MHLRFFVSTCLLISQAAFSLGEKTHKKSDCFVKSPRICLEWQVRSALINSSYKDGKCITVGYNLDPDDLIFFHSLDSQLIHIRDSTIDGLSFMMYNSWCVRYSSTLWFRKLLDNCCPRNHVIFLPEITTKFWLSQSGKPTKLRNSFI